MSKVSAKHILTLSVLFLSIMICAGTAAADTGPKLFFSDMINGPKTGWEGSATKGAAVTIWGRNFGTGTDHTKNYVTCGGQRLTSDGNYAEWGTSGKANSIPRDLQRITFYLNSGMTDGSGTITVTVNGLTSNTIPFYVRNTGNIYFISLQGSDGNNGRYATAQGSGVGPWKSPRMSFASNNSVIRPGDVIYIRQGLYTSSNVTLDDDSTFLRGRNDYGEENKHIAVVGYPNEIPVFDTNRVTRGFYSNEYTSSVFTDGHGADYLVFSKIKTINGLGAIETWGVNVRVVGCEFNTMDKYAMDGVIMVDTSRDVFIFGNYFYNNGYDYYKHNIYIKTMANHTIGSMVEVNNVHVAWNEFDSFNNNRGSNCRGGDVEIQTESGSGGRYTKNVYIYNNYFHHGNTEWLYLLDARPVYAFGNIVGPLNTKANQNGGLIVTGGVTLYLFNNTFYLAGIASSPSIETQGSNNVIYSKNNIWYTHSGQSFIGSEYGLNYQSDHDAFYPNAPYSKAVNAIDLASSPYANPAGGDFSLNDMSTGGRLCKDSGTDQLPKLAF